MCSFIKYIQRIFGYVPGFVANFDVKHQLIMLAVAQQDWSLINERTSPRMGAQIDPLKSGRVKGVKETLHQMAKSQ